MALTYADTGANLTSHIDTHMADEMDTSRFMPPFTQHICNEPTLTRSRGDWIVSHSVPPFYVPIPPETASEQKNNPATVTDPALIEQIVLHAPDSLWRSDIVHGIKRTGWAGTWLIIFFLIFLAYGNLPNRWYHILYVYSGSMSPAINPGDLIIITPPTKVLEPGMILTMRVDGKLVTHRLLGISSDGLVITKGDANNTPDNWDQNKLEIGGIVRGRIPYLGYLSQISGFFNQTAAGAWFADAHEIKMDMASGTWVFEPTAAPPGQSGTSITASVTVEGVCVPSTMILPDDKYSDLEKCENLSPGDPGAMEEEDGLNAYGQVCLTNSGDAPTRDLKVLFQVQFKTEKGPFEDLKDTTFEFIPTGAIAAATSRCYTYRIGFAPVEGVVNYRMVSHVTITNHSGYLPGSPHCIGPDLCPFGPDPKADFTIDPVWLNNSIVEEILQLDTPIPTEIAAPTETPVTPVPPEIPVVPDPTEMIEPPTEIPPIIDPTEMPTEPVVTEEVVEATP
jgi:signal peptidase I